MGENVDQQEDIIYPSIVFEIENELYSINSKYVASMQQLPKFERVEKTAPYITGMFTYRNSIVYMLDLRIFFNMPSLKDECDIFHDMIEKRKEDHVKWVNELERTITVGEPFTLATDPHQCAFGKWYDAFESDNTSVNFLMRKIEEPHRRLHEAAIEAQKCKQECNTCKRNECLKDIMGKVKQQYVPHVLGLLDEAKKVFEESVYHEMILVLSGSQVGIVVDKVWGVEELEVLEKGHKMDTFFKNSFVSQIQRSKAIEGLISELDINKLLTAASSSIITE